MAADIVPGARGSLARTSVISQSALRAPGPRLGAQEKLACPVPPRRSQEKLRHRKAEPSLPPGHRKEWALLIDGHGAGPL